MTKLLLILLVLCQLVLTGCSTLSSVQARPPSRLATEMQLEAQKTLALLAKIKAQYQIDLERSIDHTPTPLPISKPQD